MKRLTAILLTLCMAISAFSFQASAEADTECANAAINGYSFNISADNSFGSLIAGEFAELEEMQAFNNGYNIFTVEIHSNEANVEFETQSDCTLIVGIYDEGKTKLLASGNLDLTKDMTQTAVTLSGDIPEYFYIRAFLVDSETFAPLCTEFTSSLYTKSMKELLNKTVDDFDASRVVNLDDDKATNFFVVGKDTVLISHDTDKNVLVSIDDENRTYIFKNAGNEITSLANGDKFVYCDDTDIIAIKVASVKTVDGKTTVTGKDAELNEIFDCIKIEGTTTMDNVEIDTSALEEGVEFIGLVETEPEELGIQPAAIEIEGKNKLGAEFKIKEKKIGSENNQVKLSGSINIGITPSVKLYLSFSEAYIELKFEYDLGFKVSLSGKVTGKIPLCGFTYSLKLGKHEAFKIDLTPAFMVELSAKLDIEGKINGTVGFKCSTKDNITNLTTVPQCVAEVKVEGAFFLGVSFEPEMKALGDKIDIKLEAKTGAQIKAKLKATTEAEKTKRHECNTCLDGNTSGLFKIGCKIKLTEKWKYNDEFNVQIKLFDFYYSFDHKQFGFSECPYYEYKTTIVIKDKNGRKIEGAIVNIVSEYNSDTITLTTDKNGRAEIWLFNGDYTLTASFNSYKANMAINIGKSSTIEVAFEEEKTYKTTIKVLDGDGNSASGANIDLGIKESRADAPDSTGELVGGEYFSYIGSYTTDTNGLVILNLKKGDYIIEASKGSTAIVDKFSVINESTVTIKIPHKTKDVSLGENHSAALMENGSLYMWGKNENGQLGDGLTTSRSTPFRLMGNVKAVSLGRNHSGAITNDGSLYMWGDNSVGQLGDGTTIDRHTPIKIMDNVKFIYLGDKNSAVITKGGSLYMWGDNSFGQLGDGTKIDRHTPVKIMDNVQSVSLGYNHSGAITNNGSLYMWGNNSMGQLGDGTTIHRYAPVKIMDNVKSVSLSIPNLNSAAITEDGTLYMWGDGKNVSFIGGMETPNPVKIMDNVVSVSFGFNIGVITRDGSLYTWLNGGSFLGGGTLLDRFTHVKIMDNVKTICIGSYHSGLITEDGSLYMWGRNDYGQVGDGTTNFKDSPIKIKISNSSTDARISKAIASAGRQKNAAQTAEFTGLKPGETYNFYVMKSRTVDNPFAASNLLYIDQGTAGDDGSIRFKYIPREACDKFMVFVVGISVGRTGDAASGDANGDGAVNNIDATLALQYDSGLIELDEAAFAAADVDGNGAVNNIDASRILQLDAGIISEF